MMTVRRDDETRLHVLDLLAHAAFDQRRGDDDRRFVGRGRNRAASRERARAGVELVRENLVFILNTTIRERYMDPTFGSRISNALFMLDTEQQRNVLHGYVLEALQQEPRIEAVGDINISDDPADPHALRPALQRERLHRIRHRRTPKESHELNPRRA